MPAHLSTLTRPDTVSRVPQAWAWHSPTVGSGGPARGRPSAVPAGNPCGESRAGKAATVRTDTSVKRTEKPTVPGPDGMNRLWPRCRKSNLQP